MIEPTKRKFQFTFLSVIFFSYLLLTGISVLFIHYSAIKSAQDHIFENLETELLPQIKKGDFETLGKIIEDELFQILDRKGDIVFEIKSPIQFNSGINFELLKQAFEGISGDERVLVDGALYMVMYLPLDKDSVIRGVLPMDASQKTMQNYIKIMMVMLPFLVLFVYLISRYLVNQALKPIIDVLKYQETFSSNVTHELNSPLTAIKGNIEVTLKKERTLEEYAESLKQSLKNINEIIELLNNLYLLSAADYKPLDMQKEVNDIETILNEVIERHEPTIFLKNIKLHTDVSKKLRGFCDYTLLKRAIENIVGNAVKYSPVNGEINIKLSSDREKNILVTENTSEKIERDEMKKIFTPFFRCKNSINIGAKGSGLGLYISRYIVESHGGTITAEMKKGIFRITVFLPRENQ